MNLGRNRQKTQSIDRQISDLIPELSDRRYAFKMPDHQRQRLFCGAKSLQGDPTVLSLPVNVKLSANDLVQIYLSGGSATPCACTDVMEYYTNLHKYVTLWIERSKAMPDERMPPIEDFVNIDDYLSSIHDDYFLQTVINKKPIPVEKSIFRSRRFSDEQAAEKPASPLANPKRYVSLIDQFHPSVWSRND